MDQTEIAITEENYDALAAKYHPAISAAVARVAKMHKGQLDRDDLYQMGLWALWDSIKNFDPTRGIFFGHYLKVAMNNRMSCYARNLLPHFYKKKADGEEGFDRISVHVESLDSESDKFRY